MKAKFYTLIIFCFLALKAEAQLVYLPDTNWRNFLITAGLGGCISNDTLDVSCPSIQTITSLNCEFKNVTNINGIEYFSNLSYFNCTSNFITDLPQLPSNLDTLNCTGNPINSWPTFPVGMSWLSVVSTNISTLPNLNSDLKYLYCGINNLTSLPVNLPDSLKFLSCERNQIVSLPPLTVALEELVINNNNFSGTFIPPQSLKRLSCSGNSISALDSLPPDLNFLECSWNQLTTLPVMPISLEQVYATNNQISHIDSLPPYLWILNVANNQLQSIPPLPDNNHFSILNINNNLFSVLPILPNSISELVFSNNSITVIDSLPQSLRLLHCYNNQLTSLPDMPPNINTITLQNNNLLSFGRVSNSLRNLDISINPISCLPLLGPIQSLRISQTNIHCLPKILPNVISDVDLDTFPVCGLSSGCPIDWNITGVVYNDLNNNCTLDTSDDVLNNIAVRLDSAGTMLQQVYTNGVGQYSFHTAMSTYEVVIDSTKVPFLTSCPSSGIQSVSVTLLDSLVDQIDFGLSCRAIPDIISNSITASHNFISGRSNVLYLNAGDLVLLHNTVCFHESGTVTAILGGNLSYTAPAWNALVPTSINGDTVTWVVPDFSLVDPEHDFNIFVTVSPFATIGDSVCINLSVTSPNDFDTTNNTVTECYPVFASYDPNMKLMTPMMPDTSDYWFTFTVLFQNTGTASAENIFIIDTLDADLDPTTFELIASSHDVVTQLLPGNILRFNYHSIYLVDSSSDEPASHGFVKYKIRRDASTGIGTEISNTAYIYFDFNEAIVTNTVTGTVSVATGIPSQSQSESSIRIFPNPASTSFTIESLNSTIENAQLLSLDGKVIRSLSGNNSSKVNIRTESLEAGLYIVKVLESKSHGYLFYKLMVK